MTDSSKSKATQVGGNQYDTRVAKKYPMPGNIKGSIYGTPEVSSILACFESNLLDLHGKRPYYRETSKAWYRHQDRIRLEAAQAIMDYKANDGIVWAKQEYSVDPSNPPTPPQPKATEGK